MNLFIRHLQLILPVLLLGLATAISARSQQSVLRQGTWYKIAVEKEGVYRINYDFLRKMGVDVSKTDPRKIKIYGNVGGMLPQANDAERPIDLIENSILVNGENDGTFDKSDFILFYAQGADYSIYDPVKQIYKYEHNLYADKNYYFLIVSDSNGKRLETINNGSGGTIIRTYDDYAFHEIDEYNDLKSGREWFGEKFDLTLERTLEFDVSGIAENSDIKVVSDVMAQAYATSSFKIFFNDVQIAEQIVLPIPNAQYAVKGRHHRDTFLIDANTVGAPGIASQKIKYQYIKSGSGRSIGYLDFLLVSFSRKLALYDDQTIFSSSNSIGNTTSQFEINQASSISAIWDVTDPYEPKNQNFSLSGSTATFSTNTESLKKFVVFSNNFLTPVFTSEVATQNLHGHSTPHLLIVAHPDFKEEASRLAMHRQQNDGWSTLVATTEEIYNEFSSGRQDVTAIRDYAKFLYDKNPSALKSLLLFGRCSYDFKDRLSNNTNFVPTYESRNSLHPLETYSSDDYFGFLENDEGVWSENLIEDHTLEIGVGRLPVKTVEEARSVVDKIIQYDTDPKNMGRWRKDIVFVADDGDFNIHQSQSNQLAEIIETGYPQYNTRKIFVDAYQQILKPGGETAPEVNKAIEESLDRGSLIINYTGHGGEKLWAQERIFDDFAIAKLENKTFPLFVTATCEFGRQDDPGQISSAELSVLRNNSGAIGMVSTARPVNSSTNYELNKAFYNALFQQEDGKALTLGEVFRRTKNNSTSGVSNRNFSLIGDPSMTLAFPEKTIRITEIFAQDNSDTLRALSRVTVKGEIQDDLGNKDDTFSGTLEATLFDKETKFTTFGNENPPFTFSQWHNALFRGKASVTDGEFEFEFIVPKNIAYSTGQGKFSLYAYHETSRSDAAGSTLDFVVGKSEPNPEADNTPPVIELFMGDTTFYNGGITSQNSILVARLFDESGINISGYGIGNSLTATLDGAQDFILNDYYETEKDNYQRGWVNFPMKNLSPGKHTLTLNVWDTHNNPSTATIDFLVTDGESIVIESFANYPNPFDQSTKLYFTHNRSGDDLYATVYIADVAGNILKSAEFMITSSNYRVELMELDSIVTFGKKLPAGLYLARLVVRSLSNGSKNEQVTKLIALN